MKGKLIAIEGLDGSGKATQAQLLYHALMEQGEKVTKITFPDYQSDSSALVRMYLEGAFGKDPNMVNPYAASSFFAVDRYASYMIKWKSFYTSGGIVIADRYTTSNAIHQCAKLPENKWDSFLDWLFHYEFELLHLPAPDITVFLRVDPKISQKLLTARYAGNETKKDIHEANHEYIHCAQKAAEYCCQKLRWEVIECIHNGVLRSAEDISTELIDKLRRKRIDTT